MSASTAPTFISLLRKPAHFVAFGFGAGLVPKAPGTVGSLVALPLYPFVLTLPAVGYALTVTVLFIVGIGVCAKTERDLGAHDHPGIVWDEIVGMLATLFLAPAGWAWVAVGFGLFRLFDIGKPFPINWLNRRVAGGLGIMLDDLIAALFAALSLQALHYLWTMN
ncbi:MAG: phosphatidylglycerophosphatase A [Gammaproteobacteria bacterium]|nr:phosphatidylglycerophosphatase A [Gammaproteobacteria bacterium]